MPNQQIINALIQELTKLGITNQFVQTAIMSQISTETGFVPKSERSYRTTSNVRIRQVFPSRLGKMTDEQLNALKVDDVRFFDAVYGGMYGNTQPGDGFLYRGRGLNQITFKDNYRRYGNLIGVDLVAIPDQLNEPTTAARAAAAYFADSFRIASANGQLRSKFGISNVNEVKDAETAVRLALQANAGWGKSLTNSFYQGVYEKSLAAFQDLQRFVSENPVASVSVGLFFLVGVGAAMFLIASANEQG